MDVDEELEPGQRKREDLQVQGSSPTLLIEIKGIAGLPSEHDAMREWQRTDVAGLSIINDQRHLPGLQRKGEPFTDDVLTKANEQRFGLLTTWDLFRLLRSFIKLG